MKRLTVLAALLLATPAFAEDAASQTYKNLLTPLLQSGTNTGTVPVKLLALGMGGGDTKNTVAPP
jgi:hypothetical protein